MKILLPDADRILALQEAEGRFFFSAAAAMLLQKYGVVLEDGAGSPAAGRFAIAARETPWRPDFDSMSLIMEGPLHESARSRLALEGRALETEGLELERADGFPLGTLIFNRVNLRRIPLAASERSDPYPFVAGDARWTPTRYAFQSLARSEGWEPVLRGRDERGETHLVGVRQGRRCIFTVPLLDVMVQHHAMPPFPDGYYSMLRSSDLQPLERWFLAEAESMARAGGEMTVAAPRWPAPFRSCFTVRHDFDRPLKGLLAAWRLRAGIARLLECYARRGIKSTWFWRVASYHDGLARKVAGRGHEVALHTEARDEREWREKELEFLGRRHGLPPAGYTAHGGIGSAGYLGQQQIRWALAAGMSYGELLGNGISLPSAAVVLEAGVPAVSGLVMPAQHRGIDLTMRPEGHRLAALLPEAQAALRRGEHCVVMNHPDIHVAEMVALIEGLDLEGAWRATFAQVAAWYQASRVAVRRRSSPSGIELSFDAPLPADAAYAIGMGAGVGTLRLPAGTRAARIPTAGGEPIEVTAGASGECRLHPMRPEAPAWQP